MIPYAGLLHLLFLFFFSTTVADPPSRPPSIDWNECQDGIAHCAMLTICLRPPRTDPTLLYFFPGVEFLPSTPCQGGTSIRPLSVDKWLLKIQLKDRKVDPAKGIQVKYGSDVITGCQVKPTGEVSVIDGTIDVAPELYGDPSRISPDDAFCSILMKDSSKLPTLPDGKFGFSFEPIRATQATDILSVLATANYFKEARKLARCDPFSLIEDHSPDQSKLVVGFQKHKIPEVIFAKTINCDDVPGSKLFVGSEEASDFNCTKSTEETNGKPATYEYQFKKGNELVTLKPGVEVFCAIPIDETCKELPTTNDDKPKLGTENKKKTLKCNAAEFMLVNRETYLEGNATCLNDHDYPNEGAWFFFSKDKKKAKIETAECSVHKKCSIAGFYNATTPRNETVVAVKSGENITCDSATFRLEVTNDDPEKLPSNKKFHPTAITCNLTNGVYEMMLPEEPPRVITAHHNVYCVDTEIRPSAPSTSNVPMIVGVVVPLLLFIAAAAAIVYVGREALLRFFFPKRARKRKDQKQSSSLPPISSEGHRMPRQRSSKSRTSSKSQAATTSSGEGKIGKKGGFRPADFDEKIEDSENIEKLWKSLSTDDRGKYIKWSIMRRPPEKVKKASENGKREVKVKGEKEGKKEEVKEEKKDEVKGGKKEEEKGGKKEGENGVKKEAEKGGKKEEKTVKKEEKMVKKEGEKGGKKEEARLSGGKDDGKEEKGERVAKVGKNGKKVKKRKLRMKGMRIFKMRKFMQLVDIMFKYERHWSLWVTFVPYLFFVERTFFHVSQTGNHNVAEKDKTIPGFCYERLKLYLLKMADLYVDEKSTKEEDNGFFRGILWVIKYKLNIMNQDEREKVVSSVAEIFKEKRMRSDDECRFAIWGILRHEESRTFRLPGQHQLLGFGGGGREMFDALMEEFKRLLKEPLEQERKEEEACKLDKMQHLMFAMGCSFELYAMHDVWKVMNEDKRFSVNQFIFVMYGRDWLWDGAWVAMCQNPTEHPMFCRRFGQDNVAYKEITEMCIRYWADKHSDDAKNGYCFEGFMHSHDANYKSPALQRWYTFYDEFTADLPIIGKAMNSWLLEFDPRDIEGYTPVGEALAEEAKEKWEKKSDLQALAKLANKSVAPAAAGGGGGPTPPPKPPSSGPASSATGGGSSGQTTGPTGKTTTGSKTTA